LTQRKEDLMEDERKEAKVLTHIQKLIEEEHRLSGRGSTDESESRRLAAIQVELDQCWDLLRQRRALRETGGDPDQAQVRPADIVEKYIG
jgi:uncharacterized protein DUF2630